LASLAKLFLFLYGVALIGGGVMGYVKAQSQISLIVGGAAGLLALLAFWVSLRRQRPGFLLGLVITLGVGGYHLSRHLKMGEGATNNVPLMIAAASGVTALVLLLGLAAGGGRRRD
jgi:uncharacterized membrane protein (UPF0136 family)